MKRARILRSCAASALLFGILGAHPAAATRIGKAELRLPATGEIAAAQLKVVGLGPWPEARLFADGVEGSELRRWLENSDGKLTLKIEGAGPVCDSFEAHPGWHGIVYSSVSMLFRAPNGGTLKTVVLQKAKPFGIDCGPRPWTVSIVFETFQVRDP